jgi:hypothetical protein
VFFAIIVATKTTKQVSARARKENKMSTEKILEVTESDIEAVRHYTNSLGDDFYVSTMEDTLMRIMLQEDVKRRKAKAILARGKELYNAGYRVEKSDWQVSVIAKFDIPNEAIVYKVKDAGYFAMNAICRLWWLVKFNS